MGCVSSTLLNRDDDFPQIGSTAFSHHIVSLTSTTYGLLSLDPPPSSSPMTPPQPLPRFSLTPKSLFVDQSPTEVINSWELMAGLDSTTSENNDGSFRFTPQLSNSKPGTPKFFSKLKENSNPNSNSITRVRKPRQLFSDAGENPVKEGYNGNFNLEKFPEVCPPNGEGKVVIYTTTLRGVRKTFEDCNAVRSVIRGLGFAFCERDISMDRGLRDELNKLLAPLYKYKENQNNLASSLPGLFIRGRFIGGVDEVLKLHEDGVLLEMLQGLPRLEAGTVCEGCGDVRFLPCFQCNGSCKLVMVVKEVDDENEENDVIRKNNCVSCNNSSVKRSVVIRCPDCNENGLVLCPICS